MQSPYLPYDDERITAPMPPVYNQQQVGSPPPPPIWALPNQSQTPPPRPPSPRGRAGVWAFILILIGAAIAVIAGSSTGQGILAQITAPNNPIVISETATAVDSSTTTPATTATPVPTTTPVPTDTPTATDTPVATITPAIPDGFQQYNEPNGNWSIQAPLNTKITPVTATILTIAVPSTRFDIRTDVAFFEYDSPIVVSSDQVEPISLAIVQATGATQVTLAGTPANVQLGASSWESIPFSAIYKGKKVRTTVYYEQHGSTSTVLAYSSPENQFTDTENTVFLPMAKSFVLHL